MDPAGSAGTSPDPSGKSAGRDRAAGRHNRIGVGKDRFRPIALEHYTESFPAQKKEKCENMKSINVHTSSCDADKGIYQHLKGVAIVLLLVASVGGCTVLGPDYTRPEADVEPGWIDAGAPLVSSEAPIDPQWWKTAFEEPELDQLVETALQQNLTLRSAGLRVLQSQQQLAIAIGNQFPQQQQATGSAARQKANNSTFSNYSLGFNLGWEIDFWGRFKLQVE